MPVKFRRRVLALASAVVAAAAVLIVPALTSAPALATPAANEAPAVTAKAWSSALVTGYAIARPVCSAPVRVGEFTCMSFRRVNVAKGTPGAYRYTMPRWARGPSGGLTPAALASAYGYNPKAPTGKTVAIVNWNSAPGLRQHLNAFDRHYHLRAETASSLRIVNQNGASAPLPAAARDASVEISLDVETVRSVCNRCKILLVEANAGTGPSLARAENTAVRMGASVVSNSYGAPERPGHPYPRSVYSAFEHKGVVITASSGDNGWDFWDVANDDQFGYASYAAQTPSFPASVTSVVSVGATALTLDGNGKRTRETVWNNNGANDGQGIARGASLGASGGGCSRQFAAPGWQLVVPAYRKAGCAGKRLASDVSAVGDPMTGFDVYDPYGLGGWATIGGTSLSAPVIAGMWALAGGANGMAYPARALYQNAHLRRSAIHDVQVGGTAWCAGTSTSSCASAALNFGGVNNPNAVYGAYVDCSFPRAGRVARAPAKNPKCNAAPGYDGPSGVGAPNNLRLFRTTSPRLALAVAPAHPVRRPIVFAQRIATVLPGSRIVRHTWHWGDGHATTSPRYNTTHRYARAGTYTVTTAITDNFGQSVTATRRVKIG